MNPRDLVPRARQAARPRTRLRQLREQRQRRIRKAQHAGAYAQPIKANQVFYEAFSGNGVLCNPEAIFRRLLELPDMQHLTHVWALDDLEKHGEVVEEFAGDHRVKFVTMLSPEYLEALATSKYLFNNATFPPEFAKREGQVYVNTWHGVPLKTMGRHSPGGVPSLRNILRNMISADYLVSANEFMTDTMYREAFWLQGIYPGRVIEEGQPRTDRQYHASAAPQEVIHSLESHGLRVGNRRVILYAPTWKGETFHNPEVNAQQLVNVARRLQSAVDGDRYVVLVKAHQVIYDAIVAKGVGSRFLVPNDLPTNLLLGVTDVLVTDYSSLLFDFLPTERPILHHVPDLDDYTESRGLYLDPGELFGPVSRNVDELRAQLLECLDEDAVPIRGRDEAVKRFAPHEDGSVSDRIIDVVFRGRTDHVRLKHDLGPDRPTLLVYVGGLQSNGLTSSALNLLHHLDHDCLDVSVLYHVPRNAERRRNAERIDERCRHIVRAGEFIATVPDLKREEGYMQQGLPDRAPAAHHDFWRMEWRRVLGDARFDYALDVSGYGTLIPFMFAAGDVGKSALWLHNDLMADSERETNGVRHLQGRLNAVFSSFRYFDRLISVSRELDGINSQKLSRFAPPEKFTYANNTLDRTRVRRMAALDIAQRAGGRETVEVDRENLAAAVRSLLEHFDPDELLPEVRSQAMVRIPEHAAGKTFVNVARLSPEKNHERLIRAFARVHEHDENAHLVIVGNGKLRRNLRQLVVSLGIRDNVTFTGQVSNPFIAMAQADCFVLSSDYEGQPMVILEARALGLPVISTDFGSVRDSVPREAGLVVERTVGSLATGMQRFLAGEVSGQPLDLEAYNAEAMQQLYDALGLKLSTRYPRHTSDEGGSLAT